MAAQGKATPAFCVTSGKVPSWFIAVQRAWRFEAFPQHRHGGRVCEVHIEAAVAVIVEQKHTPAHGFGDVLFYWIRRMSTCDARSLTYVDKLRYVSPLALLCGSRLLSGNGHRQAGKKQRTSGTLLHQPWTRQAQILSPPPPSVEQTDLSKTASAQIDRYVHCFAQR